jgi:uncharacterized protein
MDYPRNPFRINVGFIIAESIGYSREFPLSFPRVRLQELDLADVDGSVLFTRTSQGLLAQVSLSARAKTECMRCLDEFTIDLSTQFTELYYFLASSAEETGLILPETGQVDLGPLVREYMLLEVPIKPLCRPDCKGLCPICGESLNKTNCSHEDDSIDPRLSILKSLLDS